MGESGVRDSKPGAGQEGHWGKVEERGPEEYRAGP